MEDIQDVNMAINVSVLIFEYQIKSLGRLLLGPKQTTISFIGNNDSRKKLLEPYNFHYIIPSHPFSSHFKEMAVMARK